MNTIRELSLKGKSLQRRVRRLAEPDGEWKTINGRHVLVGKGETPLEALNKSLDADKKNPWPRNAEGKRELPGKGFKIPPPPEGKVSVSSGKAPHGLVTDLLKRFPNREVLTTYLNGLPGEKLQTALSAIRNGADDDTKYVREVIRGVLKS